MEHISGTIVYAKYMAVCLAILIWLFHWRNWRTLNRHEKMKELKQWHDLPVLTPTHTQEETLDCMIKADCELLSFSFLLSITMSVLAAVCFIALM